MTETVKASDISKSLYGEATETITQVIASAESLQWFAPPEHRSTLQVEDLIREHLHLVRSETPLSLQSDIPVELLRGGLTDAAHLYRRLNSVSREDLYARGVWRNAVAQVAANVHNELAKPNLRPFIKPPLFPIPGKPGILGGMLAARRESLAALPISEDDRQILWLLMCDVDGDFWNAIQWQLARGGTLSANPFFKLIQQYRFGFYPMGISNNRFVIYLRS